MEVRIDLVKVLTVFPVADWYINLVQNPWRIPLKHRCIALVEHLLYIPLGFVATLFLGSELTILLFILLAILVIPFEIYLALHGIEPWGFLKGRERSEVSALFLCALANEFIYYTIGCLLTFI
ncbi:MAG TPA: hypothetical protein ENG60_00040 [Thermoplasmatales archaeon]|nr:hypothetical protein [Thermoplasmatales archaeon]HEX16801.1 hypothetical protein [Thermoplasmatales archaeon]